MEKTNNPAGFFSKAEFEIEQVAHKTPLVPSITVLGSTTSLVNAVVACGSYLLGQIVPKNPIFVFANTPLHDFAKATASLRWSSDPLKAMSGIGLVSLLPSNCFDHRLGHLINPSQFVSDLSACLSGSLPGDSQWLWNSRRGSAYHLLRHVEHDVLAQWLHPDPAFEVLHADLQRCYYPWGNMPKTQHSWVSLRGNEVLGHLRACLNLVGSPALLRLDIRSEHSRISAYREAAESAGSALDALEAKMSAFNRSSVAKKDLYAWLKHVHGIGGELRTRLREMYLPLRTE